MKKLSLLAAFFCLLLASAIFAQTNETIATNFTGTWEFDAAKSSLPTDLIIESGVLTVEQTKKKLIVTLELNREMRFRKPTPREEEESAAGRLIPAGSGTTVYSFGEKKSVVKSETRDGISPLSPVTQRAEIDSGGNLKLLAIGKYDSQASGLDFKTVEMWELLDDGKTLKITRETETPRGSQSAEMYFTKKAILTVEGEMTPNGVSPTEAGGVYQGKVIGETGRESSSDLSNLAVKTINGGVINGKAKKLPAPVYPAAAKAVNASGTVSVEVIIDEQGNIVSARAVSGHPLLKGAAEEAARAAEFAPTRLIGALVRVKGIITYNFIL